VAKLIQALDDKALVPASANPGEAANFEGARELARRVANQLAGAEARRTKTAEVTIDVSYGHVKVENLPVIFDKIENIVRQIAAVLPGGVKDVEEVIIKIAREHNDHKIGPERHVLLHGGD
jgi:hypothetical protein